MSFDGSAAGVVQPDFSRPSFVIGGFTEEGPVTIPTPVKVLRFEPARAFVRVSSSHPFPQNRERVLDGWQMVSKVIHRVLEDATITNHGAAAVEELKRELVEAKKLNNPEVAEGNRRLGCKA